MIFLLLTLQLLQVQSAFLAVSFREEDSKIREWFKETVEALGITAITAEEPQSGTIPEKIKNLIKESDALIGVMTKRDQIQGTQKFRPPSWIHDEIGIAFGANRKIAVFVEEGVEIDGLPPMITEYVRFNRDALSDVIPKIIELILSLREPFFAELLSRLLAESYSKSLLAITRIISIFEEIRSALALRERQDVNPRILRFMRQGGEIVAIVSGGENDGVSRNIVFEGRRLVQTHGIEEPVEIPFCLLQVYHVQEKLCQARVLKKEGSAEIWNGIENSLNQQESVEAPTNILTVFLPEELGKASSQAFETAIKLLKNATGVLFTEAKGTVANL